MITNNFPLPEGFPQEIAPREQELLVASIFPGSARNQEIEQILAGEVKWQELTQAALFHGVLPILSHRLKDAAQKSIPLAVLARWQELNLAISQANLRLAWKLVQLIELLSANGVESLQLKGPMLALQAYGEISLRQYTDLDILIHAADFSKVYDLLLRQGLTPEFDLQPAEKQFLLKTNHHFSFSSQGDSIEIHWKAAETAYQYPLHPGAMWEGAVIRVIFEREVSCPSPENTILFLCLHGAKHGWYQLKWLADLSHACQAFNSLDWPSLLQRARQTGFLRQVCLGLYLIQQHGGVEFPPPVQLALTEEREVLRLAAQIQKRWFNRGVYTGFLDPYLFYLQTRERLTDRLYNLFDSLILPKQAEWRAVPLPEYFYPAYFFIRPFRLMVIMARLGIQTLRKRFGQ